MKTTIVLCLVLGAMASPARSETFYFTVTDGDVIAESGGAPSVGAPPAGSRGATARPTETLGAQRLSRPQDNTAWPLTFLMATLSLTLLSSLAALGLATSGRKMRKPINIFD